MDVRTDNSNVVVMTMQCSLFGIHATAGVIVAAMTAKVRIIAAMALDFGMNIMHR